MSELATADATAVRVKPLPLGTNALRVWRRLAVMSTVVLFLATHWPLGEFAREWAGSDKLIHAAVFAVLTSLWWNAQLTRRLSWLVVAMALWAGFDEVTQLVPFIHRHTAWDDYVADLVGIAMVAANIRLRRSTVHSAPGQWRLALNDAAELSLLDRPMPWLAVCTTGALGMLVGIPLAMVWGSFRDWPLLPCAALGGLFGGSFAVGIALASGIRHERAGMQARRACLGCGASVGDGAIAADGSGQCSHCGAAVHAGLWIEPPKEAGRVHARRPMSAAQRWWIVGQIVVTSVLMLGVLRLATHDAITGPRSVATGGGEVAATGPGGRIETVLAIGGAAIVLGIPMLGARRRADRTAATEGSLCMWCDHDLRGTAATQGVGVCPECGKQFARFTPPPPR